VGCLKIVAFNGSPRGGRGATSIMIENFLLGARNGGAEVSSVVLVDKVIHSCLGSLYCWTKTPGRCILQDDMRELRKKVIESDAILLATPLHFSGMTSIMRVFIDRLMPCFQPEISEETGQVKLIFRDREKPLSLIVMASGSFSEKEAFVPLHSYFERWAQNISGMQLDLEMYRSQADFLHNKNEEVHDAVSLYLSSLTKAGEQFAHSAKISDDIRVQLEKPLADNKQYARFFSDYWNSIFQVNGVNGGR
jgi:multimeric flavodoxin WrbA